MADNSKTITLRMPGFFPRAPADCKQPAETFFSCFTVSSVKKNELDTLAGEEGLKACKNELAAYEKCMTKTNVNKKTESKLFRVQDEYRVNKL